MSVIDAARNVADDFPGGAKALAQRIDKNPFSLMHELSGTGTAKLGLLDSVKITRASRDLRILNAFADEFGCVVLPLPEALQADGSDSMQHLSVLAKEFGDVVQEVSASHADGDISANEMARIERQWSELVAAGQRLVAQLRSKHEESKPAHLRQVPSRAA